MRKKLLFGLLLYISTCTATFAKDLRYVIPHAVPGAKLYIQNPTDALIFVNNEGSIVILVPHEVAVETVRKEGRIILLSATPILAWTDIEGAIFKAETPSSRIVLPVTTFTGIALSSAAENTELNIRIELYDRSRLAAVLTGTLGPDKTLVWFLDELLRYPLDLDKIYTCIITSPTPDLIVGAATRFEDHFRSLPQLRN